MNLSNILTNDTSFDFTETEFNNSHSRDLLKCHCFYCKKEIFLPKNKIQAKIKHNDYHIFCNITCYRNYEKFNIKNYKYTKCKNCGKEILRKINNENQLFFCSHSCSATYNNEHRIPPSQETKNKISNTLKNTLKIKNKSKNTKNIKYVTNKNNKIINELLKSQTMVKTNCCCCNKPINCFYIGNVYCYECENKENIKQHIFLYDDNNKRICSNVTKNKLATKQKEMVINGTHKGWKTRNIESYPEKFFKSILTNNNIKYEFNFPVTKKSLGINSSSCYFLDFKINNNIDLEIDGKQHKLRKKHDIKRDELLSNYGYIIYRIEWNEINSIEGKNKMKEKINLFLSWYYNIIKTKI